MRSVRTPWRSSDTTIGTSSPTIARVASSSRPSGSSSSAATIDPCMQKKMPSTSRFARTASRKPSASVRNPSALSVPADEYAHAPKPGTTRTPAVASSTSSAPDTSLSRPRCAARKASPLRMSKSSASLGTGLKVETSWTHSQTRIRRSRTVMSRRDPASDGRVRSRAAVAHDRSPGASRGPRPGGAAGRSGRPRPSAPRSAGASSCRRPR